MNFFRLALARAHFSSSCSSLWSLSTKILGVLHWSMCRKAIMQGFLPASRKQTAALVTMSLDNAFYRCPFVRESAPCTWRGRRMEHREHFLCSFSSSQKGALPMGHYLFTPQLLLRSIPHQSSLFSDCGAARDHASSCLHMVFIWIRDYFFIENKSSFIKDVI